MIKIKDEQLIYLIDSAITDYNNQFYEAEDMGKQLPYYDEENGISEETLKKLSKCRLFIRDFDSYSDEEKETLKSEIIKLLGIMSLEYVSIAFAKKGNEPFFDESKFLEELISKVLPSRLEIGGINFDNMDYSVFSKIEDLKSLNIRNCNISNPDFLQHVPHNAIVEVAPNSELDAEGMEKFLQEISSRNGKLRVKSKYLSKFQEAFNSLKYKELTLTQYEQIRGKVDFSQIKGLKIRLEDSYNFENSELQSIISEISELEEVSIISNLSKYKEFCAITDINIPCTLIINNASELTSNGLEELSNVSQVSIISPNTSKEQQSAYTREDYIQIREKIDEIIDGINPTDSAEKKFATVYERLGKLIEYDFNAIKPEMKDNDELQTKVRNLKGGLLEGKSVCAGYADILWNVLACVGVEARYVSGKIDFERGYTLNLTDPEPGHAWNQIKLGDNWYYTDLTWDAGYIKEATPLLPYCLKSDKDFKGHDKYDHKKNAGVHICPVSFPQEKLFGKKPTERIETSNIELGELVQKTASLSIMRAQIMQVGEEIETPTFENEIALLSNAHRNSRDRGGDRDGR